jgi:hypothetical protein
MAESIVNNSCPQHYLPFLVTPQLAITNKIKYPPNTGKDLLKDPKEGTLCKVPKTWILV